MHIHLTCLSHASYMPFSCILHAFEYPVLLTYFLSIQSQTLIMYLPSCTNTNNKTHFSVYLTERYRLIFCLSSHKTQSLYIDSACYLQDSFSVCLVKRYRLIFCSSNHKIQSLHIDSACYLHRLILFWIRNHSYSVWIDYSAYIIQLNIDSFSLMFYCFKLSSVCKPFF